MIYAMVCWICALRVLNGGSKSLFGHDQSAVRIRRADTVIHAHTVTQQPIFRARRDAQEVRQEILQADQRGNLQMKARSRNGTFRPNIGRPQPPL